MLFLTIVLALIALIGLAILIGGPKVTVDKGRSYERTISVRIFGTIPLGLAVLILLGMSFTQVHAKEIGVVTSGGKPVNELGAGIHLKAPWQHVTKINETIFTDTYANDQQIPVRLGDGNTAQVSATIRWHVDPAAAQYIFSNYRSNDPAESLRDSVVDTQFKAAVNDVLAHFNPTSLIQSAGSQKSTVNFTPDYDALGKSITESMKGRVIDAEGVPMVVMDGITVSGIQYSADTEGRINALMAQVAKTQQAIQSETTAKAQAQANRILSSSLSHDPYVLVSKCLDDLADGKFSAPAGFSCWPGGNGSVVIPSGR
jgi:regulator of protease activity HflC (stomatin/prohibitin superfamily)